MNIAEHIEVAVTGRFPTITYALAMAAARDAGNRSMRAAGRTVWAMNDLQAASEVFDRLYGRKTA